MYPLFFMMAFELDDSIFRKRELPYFSNRCFFLPNRSSFEEGFTFDWLKIFGNLQRVCVEYCSGNGEWIVNKAIERKEVNWVAIEKNPKRARQIYRKMMPCQNLFLICGEGKKVTEAFPTESVGEVYINFPDPWPKNRHAKYRLIQPPFVTSLGRILSLGGDVIFVTDSVSYSEQAIKTFTENGSFHPITSPFASHREGYGSSFFESLFRSKGKEIRYHHFQKRG